MLEFRCPPLLTLLLSLSPAGGDQGAAQTLHALPLNFTQAVPSAYPAAPMMLGEPLVPSMPTRSRLSPIPLTGSHSSVCMAVDDEPCHTSASPKPSTI